MRLRTKRFAESMLLLLLAASGKSCASGPPGTMVPGTGFVLYTQEPPSNAQVLSQEAQTFLEDVGSYLGLRVPPAGLLKIYHYPNRWGLWRHLNREVPSLRWKKGACYETEEAYVVTVCGNPGKRRLQEALRHELTHYLVAVHFCDIPPWIDEGLAQVLSAGPPFPHLGEDLLKSTRLEARRAEERGCLQLLHVPAGKRLNQSQYRVACALTHDLLARSGGDGPSRLVRYLESARPGVPPEQTFSGCWGISMEEACQAMVSGSGVRDQGSVSTPEKPKASLCSGGQAFHDAAVPLTRLLFDLPDRDPRIGQG